MGGVQPAESRTSVVGRLLVLLERAASRGCRLVVFPELTLTTFFPRYWLPRLDDADGFYEREMPSPETAPLFDRARELGVGFVLGYAEMTPAGRRFNTVIAVDTDGSIAGYYRKVHLPGHVEERQLAHQHLEKYYFEVGEEGFPVVELAGLKVGLATCNDRRWAETYRVLALQGADLVAIGYNTPVGGVPGMAPEPHRMMEEHLLSVRAGAYQNSLWVLAAGKSGFEDGQRLIGGSCVVTPGGDVVSVAAGDGDELVVGTYDPRVAEPYRAELFNFALHRRPEHYGLIVERTGHGEPVVETLAGRS
ncbi:N-carbamoyl-D-amino-acid hydrolase [Ornithinimicrobium pratense]|uniref:N-carbamoyl-D-amino-acid hydrolase n=1 Tax=Ornithinimicrobium pratense TaxID=2593973 RepID=A0A5J6VAL9_9MICO|nr:N-carbamoyl-D-amino-acid hydrolase [Ornithinimicrobium pratense]